MQEVPLEFVQAEPHDIAHIIGMLETQYPVCIALQEEFHKHAIAVALDNGQHLLYQGGLCNYMYFIRKGALMGYTTHSGKEITTYISVENEFVSSLSGLYGQQPSREAIVAIEPTLVLGVHTDILQGWYQRFFDLNFIIRQVYEHYYRDAQERSHIVRIGNAKERYLYFVSTKPGYIDRLPLNYIASFLDMKLETLLRIRKQEQDQQQEPEAQDVAGEIDRFVEASECFKEKTLKVQSLAAHLGIPPYKLSRVLNTYYNKNFSDYINDYRIAYIKAKLNDADFLQSYTMEALALQAGFASRSAFYKAFKKIEGISPRTYIAIHRNDI
ncbi:helix-turn-helix domain-containing protein [Pontibacter sp. H249]|uniref:helix-turn-helix domain-containing protein n=1 Tax=Pontibacter sp. H249 TaxID=3133420 RepID=UPI0030C45C43